MDSLPTNSHVTTTEPALPTFADHLQELKSRFFWIAVYFIMASAVTYPFFSTIIHILTAPLGGQKLYYMTPSGGLAFIIKVCMYVGVIAILPIVIYHLYRFIAPVMKKSNSRRVLGYTIASSLLAVAGILFAYLVTLPAAIQFLTNINLEQISSMITVDSYVSFVMGYIIAGALLFQLPLILLMINSITPLPPGKLMNYQRHMIVGSFIIAAIVSPTPDVVNQTILAAPMVVMYQLGILAVWLRNRRRSVKKKHEAAPHADRVSARLPTMQSPLVEDTVLSEVISEVGGAVQTKPITIPRVMDVIPPPTPRHNPIRQQNVVRRPRSIDGIRSAPRPRETGPSLMRQPSVPRLRYRSPLLKRSAGMPIPTI